MEDLSTAKQGGSASNSLAVVQAVDAASRDMLSRHMTEGDLQQSIERVQKRYNSERDKRLREDGLAQYINLHSSPSFRYLQDDPFADGEPHAKCRRIVEDGAECHYLVTGAGMAGLCAAVRLRLSGVASDKIWVADSAGGFGGTWYWNRYPGLHCDVESYLYLPFLEQTGYIPTHRYACGLEIRKYLNDLADKFDLRRNAVFCTDISSAHWDEAKRRWAVTLQQKDQDRPVSISAKFFIFTPGVLHHPKMPAIPGFEKFQGNFFHTSRWDYAITGGSEQQPNLTNLQDKNVAILGTGATAIQAAPELAKFAKKLYVVQRTPSAVDWRGQRPTDVEHFKANVATGPSWQRARDLNFAKFVANYPNVPDKNLVGDAWTHAPSLQGFLGSIDGPKDPADIPQFLESLHKLDFARQERIRARVDEIVMDKRVADDLKPWYPGWCKRPTFSDAYLSMFNRANVELVDTNGKGPDSLTENCIRVADRELPVDIIVLGTGYSSPGGSPGKRANIEIRGRNGLLLDDKFDNCWNSLHASNSRGFPNMYMMMLNGWGTSANYVGCVDRMAQRLAHIQTKAAERLGTEDFVVEPSDAAEKAWGERIARRALSLAAMAGCTPGYYNAEGSTDKMSTEEQVKSARKAPWGEGWASFLEVVDAWEEEGKLSGLEIAV